MDTDREISASALCGGLPDRRQPFLPAAARTKEQADRLPCAAGFIE
jgi:hypothetical protein